MKRTSKILFLFIAIFSVLFLAGANDVQALANHHIAWRKDVNGDGKPDLLFRKYSTATPEQIEEYVKEKASGYLVKEDGSGLYGFTYNSVAYPSKWVEPDANGIHKPSTKEYQTIGYSFHKAQEGTYTYVTEGTAAAAMISHTEEGIIMPIINTVRNSIDYFNRVSSKIVQPSLLGEDEVIESLPSLIYEVYSNKGAVNKVEFGTKWNISTVQPRNRLIYRYAIIEAQRIEDGTLDTEYVYIEDRVIYHDDLLKFREALEESGWNEETDPLFISDIVISAAQYDDGGFELAKTAAEFFSQYKKRTYTRDFWPIDVVGTAEDATRAVLNSFDNVITIPKKSKRNVYIRHVGIGEHTSLTRAALEDAELLEANNPYLDIKDDFNAEYTTIYPTEVMSGKVEAYEGEIEIYQYLKKAANEYTGSNNYVAIGYNIAGGNSFDEAFTTLLLKEYYGIVSEQGSNLVEIDGLIPESESECIIIEFYYTKKPDVVYVNHLLVDVNHKVLTAEQQNIKANNLAFTGALFTNPISAAKTPYDSLGDDETVINYIQERYYRQAGQSILVRTSLDLLDERFNLKHIFDGVRYVGYQKYSSYRKLNSLYETKVSPSKDWYKPFDTILGVVVEPGTKQVNFYYYNQDRKEAAIPDKFISMEYYFKSNTTTEGDCTNENDEKIISVPSGVKAKAGLTELSKVMASAINLEYVDKKHNKHDVDIKLEYNCGSDKTTINIDNVKYSFSYFRVDELVVDTLQKITVFDASEKWASTNGSSIFNWTNDKKEYNFGTSTPSLTVKGIKTIDTSNYDNTKNWKNYFTAKVEDNRGNSSLEDPTSLSMSHEFLSEAELAEVDANGDGKVNNKDIVESAKQVEKLEDTLEDVKEDNKVAIEKYNQKVQQLNEAQAALDEAMEDSTVIAAAVDAAKKVLAEIVNALFNVRNGVEEQNAIIEQRTNDIETYKTEIANRKAWIKNSKEVTIPTLQAQQATQESELATLKANKTSYESSASSWNSTYWSYYSDYTSAKSSRDSYISNRTSLNTSLTAAQTALSNAKSDESTKCADDANSTLCSGAKQAVASAEAAVATAQANYDANEAKVSEYQGYMDTAYSNMSYASSWESYYDGLAAQAAKDITAKETQIQNTKDAITAEYAKIEKWEAEIVDYETVQIPQAKADIAAAKAERDRLNSLIGPLAIQESQAKADVEKEEARFNAFNELEVAAAGIWRDACKLEVSYRTEAAEKALNAVNTATSKLNAQVAYDTNLNNKYASYKDEYDDYATIKSKTALNSSWGPIVTTAEKKEIADLMEIYITFRASNMHITINGESLNNPAKLEDKERLLLSTAIDQRTELETPEPEFYQKAYNGIGTKVTEADYNESKIAKTVPNGVRTLAAEAKYKTEILMSKKTIIPYYKSTTTSVEDDVYYSEFIDVKQELTDGKFKLDYDGLITKKSRKVNIYTPISVTAELKSDSYTIVDQSDISDSSVQLIQLGVPFTVTFKNEVESTIKPYTSLTDTDDFVAGYYIKFDFDICDVTVYRNGTKRGWVASTGTVSSNLRTIKNQVIKAGTWIGPITSGSSSTKLKAQVYSDVTDDTINAAEERRSYTVRAYAYNAPNLVDSYGRSLALYYGDKYDLLIDMLQYRSIVKATVKNICTDKTTTNAETDVPSYFADRTYELVTLNKLYDFRITDVKDVAWKSVFRKSTNSAVNEHTGDLYYSGIRKWIYANNDVTQTVARTTAELGKDPVRTLPIGPYKHTDKTYVKAPKLGYTFSYDMKVTGAFYDEDGKPLENKYVEINTKFYYISKDGKTFLEEGRNGIYLFYKNASGKYVKMETGKTGGYELKFTPNDTYRYITDKEKISLSKDVEKLGNLRYLKLTHEMATVYQTYNTANTANNGTIITYYGEYKLPNSTIAVAVDENGKYDINKPLSDGYIGVIFDITAKAGTYGEADTPISLSYDAPTKTYAEINANRKLADILKPIDAANTSQWDYEGYLGFKNFGYQANFTAATSIRLEKGQWRLSNDMYKKIKGTVMLYDIDDRAATDYE